MERSVATRGSVAPYRTAQVQILATLKQTQRIEYDVKRQCGDAVNLIQNVGNLIGQVTHFPSTNTLILRERTEELIWNKRDYQKQSKGPVYILI